jgi:hypothetical protein
MKLRQIAHLNFAKDVYTRGMTLTRKPVIKPKALKTAKAVQAAFAEIDATFNPKVNRKKLTDKDFRSEHRD